MNESDEREIRELEAQARERAERARERAREAGERRRRQHERRRRDQRKERVLHTRISEPLAEDIRKIAEELRVPVSNIVRNVLEEAFSVVETVTENVGDLIEDVVDEADRAAQRVRHHRSRHRRRYEASEWDDGETAEETREAEETGSRRGAPPEFPDVVGWQPLILNRQQPCADCGDTLERGDRSFVGMSAGGLSSTVLCEECMDRR